MRAIPISIVIFALGLVVGANIIPLPDQDAVEAHFDKKIQLLEDLAQNVKKREVVEVDDGPLIYIEEDNDDNEIDDGGADDENGNDDADDENGNDNADDENGNDNADDENDNEIDDDGADDGNGNDNADDENGNDNDGSSGDYDDDDDNDDDDTDVNDSSSGDYYDDDTDDSDDDEDDDDENDDDSDAEGCDNDHEEDDGDDDDDDDDADGGDDDDNEENEEDEDKLDESEKYDTGLHVCSEEYSSKCTAPLDKLDSFGEIVDELCEQTEILSCLQMIFENCADEESEKEKARRYLEELREGIELVCSNKGSPINPLECLKNNEKLAPKAMECSVLAANEAENLIEGDDISPADLKCLGGHLVIECITDAATEMCGKDAGKLLEISLVSDLKDDPDASSSIYCQNEDTEESKKKKKRNRLYENIL